METLTWSYLADMLIVCTFIGLAGSALGTVSGHFICWIGEKIYKAVKKHREKVRNKMEIGSEEAEEK